jgi:hypothetical protein
MVCAMPDCLPYLYARDESCLISKFTKFKIKICELYTSEKGMCKKQTLYNKYQIFLKFIKLRDR